MQATIFMKIVRYTLKTLFNFDICAENTCGQKSQRAIPHKPNNAKLPKSDKAEYLGELKIDLLETEHKCSIKSYTRAFSPRCEPGCLQIKRHASEMGCLPFLGSVLGVYPTHTKQMWHNQDAKEEKWRKNFNTAKVTTMLLKNFLLLVLAQWRKMLESLKWYLTAHLEVTWPKTDAKIEFRQHP